MPDELEGQNQNTNDLNNETNSQHTDLDTGSNNYVFGDDDSVPYDWRGKSPEEAAASYNQLAQAARSLAQQQQQQQYYQEPKVPEKTDPELMLTDPDKWQESFTQSIEARVSQRAQEMVVPLVNAAAENAKALSRSDPDLKPLWDKFGDQIDNLMSNPALDPRLKANKTVWDNAVRAVASQPQNMETIIAERAASLAAAAGGGTERGGGSTGTVSDGELSELDAFKQTEYGARLAQRYSDRDLVKQIEASGETIKSMTEKSKGLHIQVNPNNSGEWRTELARDIK